MSDFETELRRVLEERSRQAPTPRPLLRREVVRARVVQMGALVGGLLLLATSISATTAYIRSPRDQGVPPSGNTSSSDGNKSTLYVVDEGRGFASQVLKVDGSSGRVLDRYNSFDDPSIAVSSDGSRLYVASLHPSPDAGNLQDYMEVIDTTSGKVIKRAPLDNLRWQFTGAVLFPTLAVSPTGDAVYMMERDTRLQDQYEDFIGVFDTASGQVLPQKASLGRCGGGVLLPTNEARSLVVICPDSNDVRFLSFDSDGLVLKNATLALPESDADESADPYANRVSWGSISPDGQTVYAVTRAGGVIVIDVPSQGIRSRSVIDLEQGSSVALNKVALLNGGRTMALGTGPSVGAGIVEANSIVLVETDSWSQIGATLGLDPFWSMAANRTDVFAVGAAAPYIDAIDTAARRRVRFNMIGATPRIVVVSPRVAD